MEWNFERYPAALTLSRDDGSDRELTFLPGERVRWEGQECPAHLFEAGEALYFLTFDAARSPRVNLTFVLDMAEGLVTLVTCRQGMNPKRPTYISTDILTGAILLPGKAENSVRHGYTRDLCGKAIRWAYSPDFAIVHIYVSERYYRIKLLQRMGDPDSPYEVAMRNYTDRTEPAYYLRIRDGVVLFGFTEDNMDKVTGPEISCASRCQLIDLNSMTTVGRGFGQPGGDMDLFRAEGTFVEVTEEERSPESGYYI